MEKNNSLNEFINKYLLKTLLVLLLFTFLLFLALLESGRSFSQVLLKNVSACGYSKPEIFICWIFYISLFYIVGTLNLKKKFMLKSNLPLILSLFGASCLTVSGLLLPYNGTELFIYCLFAFSFALCSYLAILFSFLEMKKKYKDKRIKITFYILSFCWIPFIILLIIWPMAGITELLPIIFTIIILLIFVFFIKIEPKKEQGSLPKDNK